MNTTFRRFQDFRSLSAAKPSQLHPLLMIQSHQKMTGSQHTGVADEAPVVREEAGEVDTAEKEVDEDMVEGALTEIVATVAIAAIVVIVVVVALTVAGETANSEDVERVIVVGEMVSGEVEVKVTEGEGTDTKATEGEGMDTKVTVAVDGDEVKGVAGPLLNHNRGTY